MTDPILGVSRNLDRQIRDRDAADHAVAPLVVDAVAHRLESPTGLGALRGDAFTMTGTLGDTAGIVAAVEGHPAFTGPRRLVAVEPIFGPEGDPVRADAAATVLGEGYVGLLKANALDEGHIGALLQVAFGADMLSRKMRNVWVYGDPVPSDLADPVPSFGDPFGDGGESLPEIPPILLRDASTCINSIARAFATASGETRAARAFNDWAFRNPVHVSIIGIDSLSPDHGCPAEVAIHGHGFRIPGPTPIRRVHLDVGNHPDGAQ